MLCVWMCEFSGFVLLIVTASLKFHDAKQKFFRHPIIQVGHKRSFRGGRLVLLRYGVSLGLTQAHCLPFCLRRGLISQSGRYVSLHCWHVQ